jgi:hypothetical protein
VRRDLGYQLKSLHSAESMIIEETRQKAFDSFLHISRNEYYDFLFWTWVKNYHSKDTMARIALVHEVIPIFKYYSPSIIEGVLFLIDSIREDRMVFTEYLLSQPFNRRSEEVSSHIKFQCKAYNTILPLIEGFESDNKEAVLKYRKLEVKH